MVAQKCWANALLRLSTAVRQGPWLMLPHSWSGQPGCTANAEGSWLEVREGMQLLLASIPPERSREQASMSAHHQDWHGHKEGKCMTSMHCMLMPMHLTWPLKML